MAWSRAAVLLWLVAGVEAAYHGHSHHTHHRHNESSIHSVGEVEAPPEKRGGGHCKFPPDAGLVAVTPSLSNGGWAMSSDQSCSPGNYCPYACPSGQMSMQWDPKATSYSFPMSMNGGLYCDEDGELQKPFPDRVYCEDGTGAVKARNKCNSQVSFCQTVLPGKEAMLIPTLVEESATLTVPDTSYWCETSAQCRHRDCLYLGYLVHPYGNWSPYVVGANTDRDGNTFVKLGWNPIYLEPAKPFRNIMPDFGVEIECEGDDCTGLPCKIDPDTNSVNEVTGDTADGAGDGSFCVETVPKGGKAHIVVFEKSGSDDDDDSSSATVAIPTSPSSSATSSSTTSTSASSTENSSKPTSSASLSTRETASITSSSGWNPSFSGMSTGIRSLSVSASVTYQPHVFIETEMTISPVTPTSKTASSSPSANEGSASMATAPIFAVMLGVCAATVLNL